MFMIEKKKKKTTNKQNRKLFKLFLLLYFSLSLNAMAYCVFQCCISLCPIVSLVFCASMRLEQTSSFSARRALCERIPKTSVPTPTSQVKPTRSNQRLPYNYDDELYHYHYYCCCCCCCCVELLWWWWRQCSSPFPSPPLPVLIWPWAVIRTLNSSYSLFPHLSHWVSSSLIMDVNKSWLLNHSNLSLSLSLPSLSPFSLSFPSPPSLSLPCRLPNRQLYRPILLGHSQYSAKWPWHRRTVATLIASYDWQWHASPFCELCSSFANVMTIAGTFCLSSFLKQVFLPQVAVFSIRSTCSL